VNDTPKLQNNRTQLGLFADDTAYWLAAKTASAAIKKFTKDG